MSFTTPPAAGQIITGLTLSALVTETRPITVRKNNDEIYPNSTTLHDDLELQVPLAANNTYQGIAILIYGAGTAADFQAAWTFPAGCTLDYTIFHFDTGGTQVLETVQTAASSGLAKQFGGLGISSFRFAHYDLRIAVGATPGTLKLQWAQAVATVENTVMKAGSWIDLKQAA